jgi:hypothetical protein
VAELVTPEIIKIGDAAEREWWSLSGDNTPLAEHVIRAVAPLIAAKALREVVARMEGAEPNARFEPGWRTAALAIELRADDIERAAAK